MIDLSRIFSTDGFMPHGMCYLWRPGILAVHVGTDSLIALAYFTISFTLLHIVRRRAELRFTWIFLSFAIFIIACGVSHVMDIWTIWFPMYWLSGGIKSVTAVASVITAVLLVKLVPTVLRFPTPSALQTANHDLGREILVRQRAEQRVLDMNSLLETRVAERTLQLAVVNQNLLMSNARFAIAAAAADLGFWDLDIVAQTLQWDDQMFKLYGRQRGSGTQTYDLWSSSLHPEDRAETEHALQDAMASGAKFEADFRIIRPSGETRHIRASAAVIRDANGLGLWMHGVNLDTTERRRASEAQQNMTALVESTYDAVLTKDLDGIIRTWNPAAEHLLGYAAEEIIGQPSARLIPADCQNEDSGILARIMQGQRIAPFETVRLRKDGSPVEVSLTISPLFGHARQVVGASKIMRDITPVKVAAAALRSMNAELVQQVSARTAQLKERESLLQEIHHRVKNNLQVISSLINMQIRGLNDESTRMALRDCQSRVMTMAKIHEMLYQSADYARVPFAKYARDLANRILSAAGTSPHHITLQFALDEVFLPVAQAIPCGLILNELVVNSLKHAFPNAAQGVIRVELRFVPERSVLLAISDDGIGISPDVNLEKLSSLGVQLVTNLVAQLDGHLELIRLPGSTFKIRFPLESAA